MVDQCKVYSVRVELAKTVPSLPVAETYCRTELELGMGAKWENGDSVFVCGLWDHLNHKLPIYGNGLFHDVDDVVEWTPCRLVMPNL